MNGVLNALVGAIITIMLVAPAALVLRNHDLDSLNEQNCRATNDVRAALVVVMREAVRDSPGERGRMLRARFENLIETRLAPTTC